jgi:hypothetical protein
MGLMYAAVFEEVSVSAIQDLFQIAAPSTGSVIVHGCYISQSASETSEQLPILVHRGSTDGSGGTTLTPSPLQVGGAAAESTVEANNTTQSTEGAFVHAEGFNVLNGWIWMPTPETRPTLSPSGRLVVELQVAPTAALTMNGVLLFEEVGGA